MLKQEYWLTNVLLEQSYVMEDGQVTGTRTSLGHLRIEDGVIAAIVDGDNGVCN